MDARDDGFIEIYLGQRKVASYIIYFHQKNNGQDKSTLVIEYASMTGTFSEKNKHKCQAASIPLHPLTLSTYIPEQHK